MDILQAARQLRPGTAWVYSLGVLSQAEDGTPRVTVPQPSELQAVINSTPVVKAPSIDDQLAAIWTLLKNPTDASALAVASAVALSTDASAL